MIAHSARLWLAFVGYAVTCYYFVCVTVSLFPWLLSSATDDDSFFGATLRCLAILSAGAFFGIIAGSLAGMISAITGGIVGALLERYRPYFNRSVAGAGSALLCCNIAAPINWAFWQRLRAISDGDTSSYIIYVGLPSLLYIGIGTALTVYLSNRQALAFDRQRK